MEETKCCEEKNINGYMEENDRLIDEINIIIQEIKINVLGGDVEKNMKEEELCMLDVVRVQNRQLKEIAGTLLSIRNTLKPQRGN